MGGKAGRNHLHEEITPLLPTGIGERLSQTISNLVHAALLRYVNSPCKRKCWTNSGGPLVNSVCTLSILHIIIKWDLFCIVFWNFSVKRNISKEGIFSKQDNRTSTLLLSIRSFSPLLVTQRSTWWALWRGEGRQRKKRPPNNNKNGNILEIFDTQGKR